MSKSLILTNLTLLTMMAFGPLVQAGSKPTFGHKPGFGTGFRHAPPTHVTGFKPTTFKPTTFSTHTTSTTHTTTVTTGKPFVPTVKPFHGTKPLHTTVGIHHGGKPFGPAVTPFKPPVTNYAKTHGVKFSHGVFYKGHSHTHWAKRFFSPRWKTWCWFCPSAKVWFYYCGQQGGYYPVTYITMAPPVPVLSGPGSLPPGGGEIPVAAEGEEPELPDAP
jgi:hypothetical protein